MSSVGTLPKIKKIKKINTEEFERLAKKVKKYFEEEAEYLKKTTEDYGHNKTRKFIISS